MNTVPDTSEDTAEAPDGSGVLHNMSAPPKSRMTVQPLRSAGSEATMRSDQADSSSGGLTWVMRIDLDRLIKAHLPAFDSWIADGELHPGRAPAASGIGLAAEAAPLPFPLTGDHHLRLRCCVAVARAMAGSAPVTTASVEALRSLPHEALCDELRTLSAAIEPAPLLLPALGIMVRPDGTDRVCEGSAERVLFALSRLRGDTFVRSSSAMIAGNLPRNITFDLWLPA